MNHASYKELVCLSACGELNDDDIAKLEKHLASCAECRLERSQMAQLASIAGRSSFPVSEQMLREARASLHAELLKISAKEPFAERVSDFIRKTFEQFTLRPAYAAAFGAAVMTAFGILIGYALFSPAHEAGQTALLHERANVQSVEQKTAPDEPPVEGDTRVENIRIIHADEAKGIVEFVYESVTPVHVSGSIGDKNVQRVLARALVEEENPGVRLRAMDVITSQSEHAPGIDAGIRAALVTALKTDENPAVRSQAVNALQRFPLDVQMQRALVHALVHDKNAGVRIAAINALAAASVSGRRIDQEVLKDLRQTALNDKNIFIRNQSRNVLEEAAQL